MSRDELRRVALTLMGVPTAEHPGDREWNPLTRFAYQTPRTYQVPMGVKF